MVDAKQLRTLRSSLYKDARNNPMKILTTPTAAINGYIRHQARVKGVEITGTTSLRNMMVKEALEVRDKLRHTAAHKYQVLHSQLVERKSYTPEKAKALWKSVCGHLYADEVLEASEDILRREPNPLIGKLFILNEQNEMVEVDKTQYLHTLS